MSEPVRRYMFDARAGTLSRYEDGALMILSADGEVVPASDYDALRANYDQLTGERFSDRVHAALHYRIRELEGLVRDAAVFLDTCNVPDSEWWASALVWFDRAGDLAPRVSTSDAAAEPHVR